MQLPKIPLPAPWKHGRSLEILRGWGVAKGKCKADLKFPEVGVGVGAQTKKNLRVGG